MSDSAKVLALVAYYAGDPLHLEACSCEILGIIPQILFGAGARLHCIDRIAYYLFVHTLAYHYAESLISYAKFSSRSWAHWRTIAVVSFIGACCAQQFIGGRFHLGLLEAAVHRSHVSRGAALSILLHVVNYLVGLAFAMLIGGLLYALCSAARSRLLEFAGAGIFLTYFSHGFSAHVSALLGRIGKAEVLPSGPRQVWMLAFPFLYMLLASVVSDLLGRGFRLARAAVEQRYAKAKQF